jgi:hypothetical protein
MDHNENIHLEIAENLLNERQLAENISRAIYNSLDALDAQLQRMIQNEIDKAEYCDEDLHEIQSYCHERMKELTVLAGVFTFNPNGCSGEQTYKFIQEFTQVSWVETKEDDEDIAHVFHFNNYTQEQFNAITDDSESEDYYNEKAYHEFTASGGCRD